MSLPLAISNLTTKTDALIEASDVRKAALDAKVAQAEAEVPLAQGEQTAAEGYRDTAKSHAATAQASLATVKAGVTFEGIAAIAAEKTQQAVDVFIYDTSLDSDGGAWRKRCQHTSWFNEELNTATRGSRREFPAVVVIVVESRSITIYDADSPDLPLWMVLAGVFSGLPSLAGGYTFTSVAAADGEIIIGSTLAVNRLRFVPDECIVVDATIFNKTARANANIAGRGVPNIDATQLSIEGLVSRNANDVAMTVLPDAPVDPDTGLPVPTIAVATGGGVSVIQNDGTVANDSTLSWNFNNTFIHIFGETIATVSGSNHFYLGDVREGQFVREIEGSTPGDKLSQAVGGRSWLGSVSSGVFERGNFYVGHRYGVVSWTGLTDSKYNPKERAMVRHTERTFATGWHLYDTVGAWLADTNFENLNKSVFYFDVTKYSDKASAEEEGWVFVNDQVDNSVITVNENGFDFYTDSSSGNVTPYAYKLVPTEVGQLYKIDVEVISLGIQARSAFQNPVTSQSAGTLIYSSGSFITKATDTVMYLRIGGSNSAGASAIFKNISVELIDADRSVNANGLIVNGTITRSPVAEGAELVGYSGFSANNYLEQSYNSDLDFGTGDFSIMGWLTSGATPTSVMLSRGDNTQANTNDAFVLGLTASGHLMSRWYDSAGTMVANISGTRSVALGTAVWKHFVFSRTAGVVKIHIDGVEDTLAVKTGQATSIGGTTSPLFVVGKSAANIWTTNYWRTGGVASSLALLRISATAPSPDQIRKIYEDERKLFEPGSQCTLYGTSDSVTALAHDPKTNLLHVGTSNGRSVFDGLVRVDNTTTPVGTAISAVNGMIAED